eukprot:1704409-Prymnesium_polylepis.1
MSRHNNFCVPSSPFANNLPVSRIASIASSASSTRFPAGQTCHGRRVLHSCLLMTDSILVLINVCSFVDVLRNRP